MKNLYLCILSMLIICHILGDFYFQTKELAVQKLKKVKALFIHCLIYSIPFAVLTLFLAIYTDKYLQCLILFAVCSVSHAVIDFAKYFINAFFIKKASPVSDAIIYVADQIIHIGILSGVYLFIVKDLKVSTSDILAVADIMFYRMFYVLLFVLLIEKPANITMLKLFSKFAPEKGDTNIESGKIGAGALIGDLERLACGIFLILGEYSAIGLILTAKSIARYKKITESKEFSEYYIIGTLFSLIYTLCAYRFVFGMLPNFSLFNQISL